MFMSMVTDEPHLMQHPMDATLVFEAGHARDAQAVATIVRRYGELVYSVGLRMTGESSAAADVSRDCVSELAAAPHRVRGELAAWLHRLAVRNASTRANGSGEHRNVRDPVEEPAWDEVERALDPALSRMPERHRLVIIQHYFQRHAQDELAQMLQVAQPVVAKRLRAALEKLREELVRCGAGCSLAHLMMLLARHGTSCAPPDLVDQLVLSASEQVATTPRRPRWPGIVAVCVLIAGLILAATATISMTRDSAGTTPAQVDDK